MVTTPILAGKQPIGVAEVSRKGASPREAGPDFTAVDLEKAKAMFDAIAVPLAQARPDDF
jgi:hypothetical protein